MNGNVIVWDIETIPDLHGFAAANNLTGKTEAEIREVMGDKFPKHIYHSIACIGALIAHCENDHWAVDAVGAPHIDERSEKELIQTFVDKIAELSPQPNAISSFLHEPQLNKDLEMPNLDSRQHRRSSPDEGRWTRFLHVASTVCVASALWIGGIIAPSSAMAGTLDDVRARGTLICGVSEGLPGFSEKDSSGVWRGFDVDFCKAVAAVVFGDIAKVEYRPLSAEARFEALKDRRIDLLSRNSTWTMSRDLELDLEFVGISYFDGQGFLLPALYGATSPLQLGGAKICVATGTTSEENASAFFQGHNLKVSFLTFTERAQAHAAYADKKCDAFTGDRSALAAERSVLSTPEDHVILRDVISKEPLGPVTRKDDSRWTGLIRWTLFALINAEELGINSKSVGAEKGEQAVTLGAPAVRSLGVSRDWLVKLIGGVGNYAEIFERNLGPDTPLKLNRGMNALWNEGGLLYAPPMQ